MPLNLQQAEFVRSAAGPRDFPRDSLPQVVFAGRSNVGKSSVINRLLKRTYDARVGRERLPISITFALTESFT